MHAEEEKTMRIPKGLYVLRFAEGPDGATATVGIDDAAVGLLWPPDSDARLTPGRAVALCAYRETTISIVVSGTPGRPAKFGLDLHDEGGIQGSVTADVPPSSGGAKPPSIEIQGHLARLGDRRASYPDWLGGPAMPMPIEGLALDAGERRRLHVAVRRRSTPLAWTTPDASGFAGTRQKNDPIVGVRIEIPEDDRGPFEIEAEGMSLGQGVKKAVGPTVEFGGDDPIVGLRLRLLEINPRPPQSSDIVEGTVSVFRVKR